jgi:segregation and condensation protein B
MFGRKGVKRVESIESTEAEADCIAVEGFSLEELGSAYANAIGKPTSQIASNSMDTSTPSGTLISDESTLEEMLEAPSATETDGVPVTPESILEAVLFLGTSNNRPVSTDKLLELLRGLTLVELEEAVAALNAIYVQTDRCMRIVPEAGGYQMQLATELNLVRDRFYGKIKETQLTQAAIDCLSLIAYQPGITREEIERQWNQPAANMLSTLVRKGLLRTEKEPSTTKSHLESRYYTTDRFLEVLGLSSLEDLPSSEEL